MGQGLENSELRRVQPARSCKRLKANQHFIAGKSRKGLIGRVTKSSWPNRKKLPDTQLQFSQRVNKCRRGVSDIADAQG